MADERIRLGVIGLGLIGQAVHLPNLLTLGDTFDVTWVCDLSAQLAEQVAREWGIGRATTSADEVFWADDVDAVLLLTPGTHAALAKQALAAGKHVLAEKPFAETRRECAELEALAQRQGRVLQVGYMKMYEPLLAPLRAGWPTLGDLRLVRVTVLHPDDAPQFDHQRYLRYSDADPTLIEAARAEEAARVMESIGPVGEPWAGLFANVLQGSVCHEFSLLRGVFGELDLSFEAAQMGAHTPGRPLAAPPQIECLGRLGPAQLNLSWNWLPDYPEYTEELALFGSAGRAYLRLPGPYIRDARAHLRIERAQGIERQAVEYQSNHETAFVLELRAFADAIVHGRPVRSTAAGAAWDVAGLQRIVSLLAAGDGVQVGGEAAAAGAAR
jgi:predicted dehydrogenase